MKKIDLLRALSGKFYKVETPKLQQTYGSLSWYLVKVYDLANKALRDTNIAFYVEKEGETDEAAYWSPSEPKPKTVVGFTQELDTYISEKIADGTLKAAVTRSVDKRNEVATVVAVKKTLLNGLQELKFLISRNADGELQLTKFS